MAWVIARRTTINFSRGDAAARRKHGRIGNCNGMLNKYSVPGILNEKYLLLLPALFTLSCVHSERGKIKSEYAPTDFDKITLNEPVAITGYILSGREEQGIYRSNKFSKDDRQTCINVDGRIFLGYGFKNGQKVTAMGTIEKSPCGNGEKICITACKNYEMTVDSLRKTSD